MDPRLFELFPDDPGGDKDVDMELTAWVPRPRYYEPREVREAPEAPVAVATFRSWKLGQLTRQLWEKYGFRVELQPLDLGPEPFGKRRHPLLGEED